MIEGLSEGSLGTGPLITFLSTRMMFKRESVDLSPVIPTKKSILKFVNIRKLL